MWERSLGFFGTTICGPALDFDCLNLPELAGLSLHLAQAFPMLGAKRSSAAKAEGATGRCAIRLEPS
jgi:hypothetical protein